MRRMEDEVRGAPPFRVLGDTGGPFYVSSSPPSALAPDPYKLTTPSSGVNRARRRSSFVIIAEARPATPTSRSPSPNLASGRASPFRGRGFKGPPPRAQSRPQTPEAKDARRVARIDRRMSTSQQNSPKRSMIPQLARRRSVSLSKAQTEKTSPKYGRRATTSKNYLEVTNVASARRGSLKVPGLSPIQGTPTKPPEKRTAQGSVAKKSPSPVKSVRRNSTLPPTKSGGRLNPILKTKPPSKPSNAKSQDPLMSPSKIPVKKGSIPDLKVQFSRQNSRRGSVAKLGNHKTGERNEKLLKEKADQTDQKKESKSPAAANGVSSAQQQNTAKKTDEKPQQHVISKEAHDDKVDGKENSLNAVHRRDDEPSLMDLLKQSSGASGTSSVVNTTTVTAAQPLQIDAVAFVDNEMNKNVEKDVEVKRRNPDSGRKIGGTRPMGMNVPSDTVFPSKTEDPVTTDPKVSDSSSSTMKNHHQTAGSGGTQRPPRSTATSDESRVLNGAKPKTNGQTVGNEMTVNPNSNPESNGQSSNAVHGLQPAIGGQQETSNYGNNRTRETMKDKEVTVAIDSLAKNSDAQYTSVKNSGVIIATPKSTEAGVNGERHVNQVNQVASSDRSYNSDGLVTSRVKRADDYQLQPNSAASLKSSASLSTGSTDTGVSVNTVRGVSSAREKRGMHMVKNNQGIETLSGNVVHLEQNGEPVVPGALPSDHHGADQDRGLVVNPVDSEKSRWRRILDRCCGCCKCNCDCCDHGRIMRCLACRRGLKSQVNQPITVTETTPKETPGCLSKLKTSSRCCRLPNWKGCSRGSRVAPTENGGCCPPERRCGAIFRRLCSGCSCKRRDAPQQIRNVQAKQSLTSVAAPVLSEEPKSKIPEVLVEHNAPMRGAIPCLPIPLAWFCLVWNVLLPGTGTFWSGLFNLCVGQPRFSAVATPRARIGAFFVNTIVGVGQMFTVLFCLVGWGWSIWWGVMMVRLARKYKRFRDSEAASNDVEARVGGEVLATVTPGVPDQTLRGYERAR